MARTPRAATLGLDAITLEGALIAPAMLARLAAQPDDAATRAAYGIPGGLTLRDEIARYFRIGQDLFRRAFPANAEASAAATTRFAERLLREVLGFSDVAAAGERVLDERAYAVTLEALGGRVPMVVVPLSDGLDRPSQHLGGEGRRRSAASALQDWLNANGSALWGLCSNGETLRLARANSRLTRPAFIEADLRHIFERESFADFTAVWLLLHASRFGRPDAPPADSTLERWREEGGKEGIAARARLRDGVEEALRALGTGFLSEPRNAPLRQRLSGAISPLPLAGEVAAPSAAGEGGAAERVGINGPLCQLHDFFGELLRLVYRLIFLLTAEDRDLLHPPGASAEARDLYARGYSLARLRDRAIRRAAWDAHHDAWQGLLIVFAGLAAGEPRLGLPALDGLFARDTIPALEALALPNRALMEAIFRLAWLRDEAAGLAPVNWRDMQTEELGSVYESLLELTPLLAEDGRALAFAAAGEARGHARKTTGSYYTPDALVQALLDSALDPVLDRAEAEADDVAAALLSLRVIDPACGSGHFLLAAARRIATRLARARAGGVASAEHFRHALRDVVRACIHGVDRNPMAVELTKVALWIETVDPGKPLGFLDESIRCGDSLLGVFDRAALEAGIPDAAFRPLTGDAPATARFYARRNRDEREGQGRLEQGRLPPAPPLARDRAALRALPENTPGEIAEKRRRFEAARAERDSFVLAEAADLHVAAFLLAKTGEPPALGQATMVPTTGDVWRALRDRQVHPPLLARADGVASQARAFHWPLEFPEVMAAGGFDAVLGNPPWEVMQLEEEEYFAQRLPEIAELAGATRKHAIAELEQKRPDIFAAYEADKRRFEAGNVFTRESGRFDLTARGKINTYALFAELFASLASPRGRAGVIVPTGIATDATTAPFFAALIDGARLVRLVDFENRAGLFPAIDSRIKLCLLTIGYDAPRAEFAFFLTDPAQWTEPARRFTLSPAEIARINPNTKTAPVFRSRADAELTARIYARVPVLIEEAKGPAGNPWGVEFRQGLFNMTSDSALFRTAAQLQAGGYARDGANWAASDRSRFVPLYEAKMIHQFDHRWATYDDADSRDATEAEKRNPDFEPSPRYWVPAPEVEDRLHAKHWTRGWLIGWRDITNATNERTVIATVFPRVGVGNNLPLMLFGQKASTASLAALQGCLSSLVCDFLARHKVGGTHLNFFIYEQLPILPPSAYTPSDLAFIVPRVLELTYTSHSLAAFARDLGHAGPPFTWDEDRRAHLRAELDAFYARAYGLTRDELRYILDPADALGPDYPSETFRVLKQNEIRRFGEYRTARLVLAAWDRMEQAAQPRLAAASRS